MSPNETLSDHRGDWMQTYTGRQFWPLDPRPEDVDLRDIAWSLANQCRFAGHCKRFYSVAEHSLIMERRAPDPFRLAALFHDASEAYLLDVIRPLKRFISDYATWERNINLAIAAHFGFDAAILDSEVIHLLDNRMLATEKRDVMSEPPAPWHELPEPFDGAIPDLKYPQYVFADLFESAVQEALVLNTE
jgi:uncharacterized protein